MQFFKLTFNFNVVFDLDLEVEGVSVENKDTFLCLEVSSVIVIPPADIGYTLNTHSVLYARPDIFLDQNYAILTLTRTSFT